MSQEQEYKHFILQQLQFLRGEMERALRLIDAKDKHGLMLMQQLHSAYCQMLDRDPDNPAILFSLAASQMHLGANGITIALLEKCLRGDPNVREAWNNLGGCWRQEFFLERAEECYNKALELTLKDPKCKPRDLADIYSNMGSLWVNEGCPAKGEALLAKAIEADPTNAHACWNMALIKLELKKYREGFAMYDDGFRNGTRIMRYYGNAAYVKPDDDLTGKTVVVWGEQGLGDEILFAQFIPEFIKAKNPGRVIFDCHPRLFNIWHRTFDEMGVNLHPTRKTKSEWVPREEPIHYKIALASVPQYCEVQARTYGSNAYFHPNQEKVEEMRAMMEKFANGRAIVGFGWTGGYKKTRMDQRSIPLPMWQSLFNVENTLWFSFQYTEDAEQQLGGFLQYAPQNVERIVHIPSVVKDFDYDTTLAALAACDYRLFINTTAVHACGAAALPCWTLTPTKHAWRYGGRGDELMPFYESVRQIHQGIHNDTMENALAIAKQKLIGRMKRDGKL